MRKTKIKKTLVAFLLIVLFTVNVYAVDNSEGKNEENKRK